MRLKAIFFLSLLLLGTIFSSCAKLIHGTSSTIFMEEVIRPVDVTVYFNDELIGTATTETSLSNDGLTMDNHQKEIDLPVLKQKENTLRLEAEGYEPTEYNIGRKVITYALIFDIITVVGVIVDFSTNAIYIPTPSRILYDPKKIEGD